MDFVANFNSVVKVKLSQLGKEMLEKRHDEDSKLLKRISGTDKGGFILVTDEQGYTSFCIHELMNIFGEQMVVGADEPFNGEMIFIGANLYVEAGK